MAAATVSGTAVTVLTKARSVDLRLSTGGPLLVLFYGFPLWWLLGFGDLAFLVAALPMGVHLWRIRHALTVPKGFAIWVVFLLLVLISVLALPARAPFAMGPGNILTYGYRVAWYLSVTIVLLYVGNLGPRWTMSSRIPRAVAFMFIVTVAGGLLGMVAAEWRADSLLGALLPSGLVSNPFVHSLVSLEAADTSNILGYPQVRPKAPFPYANSWGASFSAFLPFFLLTWCRRSAGWRLWAAPFVLAAAAVVVVATLNRALWGALLVGAVYAAVQAIRLRGLRGFVVVYAAVLVGVVLVVGSGLASTVTDRLDNPHSNSRRSELAVKTVESVATGSPLVGFGNTRDVQGNFESIAGGASAECQACGVPPFGTQGLLWGVLFSQGFLGAISFLAFLLYRMSRHIRSRDPRTVVLLATPLFLLIQLPFYDSAGIPLFTTMIALALMWRSKVLERSAPQRGSTRPLVAAPVGAHGTAGDQPAPSAEGAPNPGARSDSVRAVDLARSIARIAPGAIVVGGAMAVVAAGVAIAAPRDHRATVDVLIHPAPVYLPLGGPPPRAISMDTEAHRALSDEVLSGIAEATGEPDPRAAVDVSAYPGTSVLRLSYTAPGAQAADEGARAFADAYLRQRSDYLQQRADSALDRILTPDPIIEPDPGVVESGSVAGRAWETALNNREARVSDVLSSSTLSAELVSGPSVVEVRRNVTSDVANVLALGILLGASIVIWKRRGRGEHV